jgi:hypothetical protein
VLPATTSRPRQRLEKFIAVFDVIADAGLTLDETFLVEIHSEYLAAIFPIETGNLWCAPAGWLA